MAEGIEVVTVGEREAELAYEAITIRLEAGAREAVELVAGEFTTRAKEHASGRPGPNVITDTLRSGIAPSTPMPDGFGDWEAEVSTSDDAPYAEYVEDGTSHAPAYEFFQPAHDEVEMAVTAYFEAMMAAVAEL